jgi:hypothetical protein
MITMILLVFALVLFTVAAIGLSAGRINLIAAGLACWALAQLLTGI